MWPRVGFGWVGGCMTLQRDVVSDGISVTGLSISSPLRQVLKPRSETKPMGTESGKPEHNQGKVSSLGSSLYRQAPVRSPSIISRYLFLPFGGGVFRLKAPISAVGWSVLSRASLPDGGPPGIPMGVDGPVCSQHSRGYALNWEAGVFLSSGLGNTVVLCPNPPSWPNFAEPASITVEKCALLTSDNGSMARSTSRVQASRLGWLPCPRLQIPDPPGTCGLSTDVTQAPWLP